MALMGIDMDMEIVIHIQHPDEGRLDPESPQGPSPRFFLPSSSLSMSGEGRREMEEKPMWGFYMME